MTLLIRESPGRYPEWSGEVREQEELLIEASRLRQAPDWERLIDGGTTPELVVGGERRLKRRPPQ